MSLQDLDVREFRALAHVGEGQPFVYFRGDNAMLTGR